jgi:hypothetical protein
MLIDRANLYHLAYFESDPLYINGKKIGSWVGHVRQYKQKQKALRSRVSRARSMGCKVTTDADRWGSIDPPSRPSASFN